MTKLIQICASQNDLFALDDDGTVFHYNFNTNTWVRLGSGQRDRGGMAAADGESPVPRPEMAEHRGGPPRGPGAK